MKKQDLKARIESYAGGQIEIQNNVEDYLYRGQIDSIKVKEDKEDSRFDELEVKLKWLAKSDPEIGGTYWKKDSRKEYVVTLYGALAADLEKNRMGICVPIINEMITLYPKGGSRLEPSEVKGLKMKKESKEYTHTYRGETQ